MVRFGTGTAVATVRELAQGKIGVGVAGNRAPRSLIWFALMRPVRRHG